MAKLALVTLCLVTLISYCIAQVIITQQPNINITKKNEVTTEIITQPGTNKTEDTTTVFNTTVIVTTTKTETPVVTTTSPKTTTKKPNSSVRCSSMAELSMTFVVFLLAFIYF